MLALIVIVGLVIVVGLYLMGTYNGLVRARNDVKNAWSAIDVQLKRRHDLIPNLVETVKGYAGHERQTLEAVTKARQQAVNFTGNIEERAKVENVLTLTPDVNSGHEIVLCCDLPCIELPFIDSRG